MLGVRFKEEGLDLCAWMWVEMGLDVGSEAGCYTGLGGGAWEVGWGAGCVKGSVCALKYGLE